MLVGVDGSKNSDAAVSWVADIATGKSIAIIAATVNVDSALPRNWRRGIEERIRTEWATELTRANLPFDALALQGRHVADSLIQAAADNRSDMIVVGMRGVGGFTGLRIGGTALKVLRRTDRPVVLIPPPA